MVVVIAAFGTHTSTSPRSGNVIARDVEPDVAPCGEVDRHDLHAVRAQRRGDGGADAARRARHDRLHAVTVGVSCSPARPASVFS